MDQCTTNLCRVSPVLGSFAVLEKTVGGKLLSQVNNVAQPTLPLRTKQRLFDWPWRFRCFEIWVPAGSASIQASAEDMEMCIYFPIETHEGLCYIFYVTLSKDRSLNDCAYTRKVNYEFAGPRLKTSPGNMFISAPVPVHLTVLVVDGERPSNRPVGVNSISKDRPAPSSV